MTAKNADAAVANANAHSSYTQGMCLQFVRGPCWEVGSFYASAIDAWNGAAKKHPGDRNPPEGAPMFYRGGNYGHIVISKGSGRMRSTDCTTATHVNDADLDWPEHAWGDDYLGWTEDLNGVDLPLGSSENGDDEMPQYDHAATSKAQHIQANEWQAITWANSVAGPAIKDGDNVASLGGRRYTASLKVTVDAPTGAIIRLQCVEVSSGAVQETDPQTEVPANGGGTYGSHEQIGVVKEGRRLRWRITCTQDATLTHADVAVLSW